MANPTDADRARHLRHAALIDATHAAIDALPPLSPDATPRSFEVLKAEHRAQEAS